MKTYLFILLSLIAVLLITAVSAQVLGIDLSAENTKVAAVRTGVPFHVVIDEQAKRKIPLAIAFDDGQRHYGNNAIGFALRKPLETYLYAQRLLGQSIHSARLEALRDSFAYDFVTIPGRGTAVGIKATDGTIYSPEELVAMSLEHILKIAIDDGNVGVKDAVITVPHWFSATEKEALLQAAELAGMSVMSFITDTGASSIQYGLDRTFDNTNTTQHVCIVDIGASGTEFSYITYNGVKQRSGPVKIAGHAHILASYSDENVGGHFVDKIIRNYFLDLIAEILINKKNPEKITIDDIKKQPRSMAKLLKQAQAVKTILAANQEAKVHIESVYKDIDLSTTLKRSKFEELIQSQLTALDLSIQKFKQTLPSNFVQFDDIVIVGGTSRIPIFQQALKQSFSVDKLAQTLNSDEAMVMGAVFMAANQSISFQVRPFLFTDATSGDIHVHINDEPLTIDTNYPQLTNDGNNNNNNDDADADDKAQLQTGKHVVLFPKHSPSNKRKTLTLTRKSNMFVSVNYNTEDVCQGCHGAVKGYTIDGVDELYQDYLESDAKKQQKEIELGLDRLPVNKTWTSDAEKETALQLTRSPPKGVRVSLTFTTVDTHIPRLVSAEALMDDWVVIDHTAELNKEKEKLEKKKKLAAAKKAAKEKKLKEERENGEEGNNSGDDKKEEKIVEEPIIEEEKQEKQEQLWRLERRVKRSPLNINQLPFVYNEKIDTNIILITKNGVEVNGFIPMSPTDKISSKAKLSLLNDNDNARRELSEARNTLESLIYQVKNEVDDDSIIAVSNEKQREDVLSRATELHEWLDNDGDDYSSNDGTIVWYNARRDLLQSKIALLNELFSPILYRQNEYLERENTWHSLENAFILLANTTLNLRTSKPWILEQLDEIDTQMIETKSELTTLYHEQRNRDQSLDPIWINKDVVGKFALLHEKLKKAGKIPKPKPPKAEKKTTDDGEDNNSSDNNGADVNVDGTDGQQDDKQQQQQQQNGQNGDDKQQQQQGDEDKKQTEDGEKKDKTTHDEL
jgi:hypoxia up-regulated 1